MRIAFIVNNYPPRTGGVELHVRSLGRELTHLGHEVLVVTLGPDTGWSQNNDVRVLTLPEHFRVAGILGFPSFGTRKHLSQLLSKLKIDVVSVHTRFFPMSFVGVRAAKHAGIPVVHTEHGSDHVASDSGLIRWASRAVDFTLGRAVLRSANRVLGVSEEVTAFVRRLAHVDADVFPNAIEPSVDAPQPPSDRPSHLVFVGRIVAGKGWREYLSTVAAVRDAGHSVSGEVIGDGPELLLLRKRVAELGLSDVVWIRGRVPQTEVRVALRGATLLNPTTLSEGFQTTVLETLAESGRVVTYPVPGATMLRNAGANVRVTEEKQAADLVEATFELLRNPGIPTPAGFIEDWLWPSRAEQYAAILDEVTSN